MASPKETYRKHFIPLESNPDVFTELVHKLGVSPTLAFHDVYSLDDADLLAIVPRPVYALVLVFPTTDSYKKRVAAADDGSSHGSPVVFFEQTINNACGLYALLHAICNGKARTFIKTESWAARLLKQCEPLDIDQRSRALEDSEELESTYASVARKGDTRAPDNPEDDVDFHYNAFVKSHQNGHLFLLDGARKKPVDLGAYPADEDVLAENCLKVIRRMVAEASDDPRSVNFSLMALAPALDG
ncbi:ubiquitin C-terminal hydrolase L3 [Polyplosphaeria fusca]|uniref:Ubiquitin carboxyl-terminal hydrolase n=1 Tax=Polyplosphaeria fusca TaxID=682080 RepID=A0A9P4QSL0_9PLEO|nr:ubiquitin C-terminal hydrolase L3 [Polyplosphaeria fusca]